MRISAGWFRELGFEVDSTIPDCATIAREHVAFSVEGGGFDVESKTLTTNWRVTFTGPFEWISATVEVRPDA